MTMTVTVNSEKQANGAFEQAGGGTGIRVILADSQAIYRVGMKKVFALEDDIRVVAQAETLANLHTALQRYPTDVVVLEGQLSAGTIDAIPDLVRRSPDAKLIVQVAEADEANIVELYRRGVRGVVPRSISPDLLIKCVRKIADGGNWVDKQSLSWVIEAYRSQASSLTNPRVQPKLSKKELAIISCITRGMRNKEIAYQIDTDLVPGGLVARTTPAQLRMASTRASSLSRQLRLTKPGIRGCAAPAPAGSSEE